MKAILAVLLLCALAECSYRKFSSTTIKFKFDKISKHDQAKVRHALERIESKTCLKFVYDANVKSGQRITFKQGNSGCYSHLGAVSSGNEVTLSRGCFYDHIIQKEVMHSLGFENEVSRHDRDKFVIIHFDKISPRFRHVFKKATRRTLNEVTEYDYTSILHYAKDAFSMKRDQVIQTRNPKFQDIIGRAKTLSALDVMKIKINYC